MKKLLLSAMLLTGLFGVSASAQTFVSGDLTYTVTSPTDKTVEVAKPSKAYALAEVTIPATVTNEGVTYNVTGIAQQAFMSNATLVSITMPDGMLTIGKQAFQGCSNLTTVNMGNTVVSIGDNCFFTCAKVTELHLSKTVKTIGQWGLRGMSGLLTLTLGEELEGIPAGMCWGNTKLQGITIPDKTKYVGENAFASCSALDSIQLGTSVDSLASKAFAYCSNVKKVISRAPVPPMTMDEKSMVTTYTKTSLYVSEKALEVYQKTEPWKNFEVILPYDPSGSLEDKFFVVAGVGYEMISADNRTVGVAHIDTLTYTGEVLIRPTVNYAGEDFNVIAIQAEAFKNCTGVTQIEIPASIQSIGNNAFNGCSGMKYFVNKATTVPTLGTTVFNGMNFANCVLFVPQGTGSNYAAADQWKSFTNRSVIIDEVTINGQTYKCNNIIECTLDFTGAKGATGELVIPDEIDIDGTKFYVTNIAGNSFYSTKLTGLVLPSTLKTISGSAFFTLGEYNNPIERIIIPEGVTSIGSNAFYGSHVNYVELPKKSLTNLAASAFYSCDIKGIEIPGSVGVINNQTFYGSHMNWVILGEGITDIKESAFFATRIGSLSLPSTMKNIEKSAFSSCSYLSSLIINDGLASVDASAFDNCNSLYKVFSFAKTMPQGLEASLLQTGEKMGTARTTYSVSDILKSGNSFGRVVVRSDLSSWFDYNGVRYLPSATKPTDVLAVDASYKREDLSVDVPEKFTYNGTQYKVISLASYLLCGQTTMKEANVTYPMVDVPDGFVYNAVNLKSINIPNTIQTIGQYAFASTDSLDKVDLPEGLTKLGMAAFYYAGIKELTVPSTVTIMDHASVSGCRRLTNVVFKDGASTVALGVLPTMFGNRPLFTGSKLESVTIGRNLYYTATAAYGYSPFAGDSILQRAVITDVPTTVGDYLFKDCKTMTNVSVGKSVKRLGNSSFDGCLALDSIGLGKSISSLGTNVFANCSSVKKLYCEAVTPPVCSANALAGIDKDACTLYVPGGSIDQYKAANQWKEFFNISAFQFSGVSEIFEGALPGRYVVYNLNGVLILDTTDETQVNNLPRGLYIINGKKVIK